MSSSKRQRVIVNSLTHILIIYKVINKPLFYLALECHDEAAKGHVGTQSLTNASRLPEHQESPVFTVVEEPWCRQMDVHTRADQKENNL